MSEEEKKAIEYLKRHILPCYGSKGGIEFMLNDIILNLIEKQSKEIEELNSDLGVFKRALTDIEDVYNANYISKTKIKEKIKELKERPNKMVIDKEVPEEYKNIFLDENAIQVLKELLEEE